MKEGRPLERPDDRESGTLDEADDVAAPFELVRIDRMVAAELRRLAKYAPRPVAAELHAIADRGERTA
jgi:hypothetical protein